MRALSWRDPLAVAATLRSNGAAGAGLVLLDSALPGGPRGRHSYLCADPRHTVLADRTGTQVDGDPEPDGPWAALRRLHALPGTAADGPGLPPFRGGLAGLFGYDLGRHLERLPAPPADPLGFPELMAGLFDAVCTFDHERRTVQVIAADTPEAQRRAGRLAEAVDVAGDPPAPQAAPRIDWRSEGQAAYEARVQRIVDYIRAGDIFQANLSARFTAVVAPDTDALALYARLRATAPAPFAALVEFGGTAFLSASPERFLRLQDGRVETRPIKGTRPRHADPGKDARLATQLLASEKDRAENLMIVDLMRNDISRVCRTGSVSVPELCALESYATVHHLVSAVTGTLRPEADALDLLAACFPGGSITGAPKIRAMEVIAELEPEARGPFFGAVGWIGADGAMDSNIAIRSLALKDGTLRLQAGGGVVADSDPAAEYREMRTKARALFAAAGGEPPDSA